MHIEGRLIVRHVELPRVGIGSAPIPHLPEQRISSLDVIPSNEEVKIGGRADHRVGIKLASQQRSLERNYAEAGPPKGSEDGVERIGGQEPPPFSLAPARFKLRL